MIPRPGDKLKRPRPWADLVCKSIRPDGLEVETAAGHVFMMSVERWREIARESGVTS